MGIVVTFIFIFWGMKRGGGGKKKLCVYYYVVTLYRFRDEEGRGGREWGEGL
jgi:hypothetical protein